MLKTIIILIFTLSISIAPILVAAQDSIKQATIVFTANMADVSAKGGKSYSRLATVLKQQRNENKMTIFVFGGGSVGPSPMSSFDRGSHIIDLLNTLEPDLMTITKREFSYFEDELSLRSYEAAFPLIASNIFDPLTQGNQDGLHQYALIAKPGIKIGFINIVEKEVVTEYLLKRIEVVPPEAVVHSLANLLKAQGADLVALTYSKPLLLYQDFLNSDIIDFAINIRTDGENFNQSIITHKYNFRISEKNNALKLGLQWQDSEKLDLYIEKEEIEVGDYLEDPEVALQVSSYNTRLDRLLNQHIGTLKTPMNSIRKSVRTEENAMANFIVDAMREYVKADVAILNGGSIRGGKTYTANSILTRKDIALELPFRSRLIKVSVTGADIKTILEHGVSAVEELKGRYPHVSGIKFKYDTANARGSRVTSITFNGKAVIPTAIYSLATSDYLIGGGDEYPLIKSADSTSQTNASLPLISEVIISAIQRQQAIAPRVDSRVLRENE
ncbi:MAG: 5'-nucleotidase C-terminal domain-containing protein [Paraglaciecola sp.]|uniref:bifunctional metallophosphatase/5'-nucleotidase n=1 Tax=Paraglaciecola sp. TaxID=1920173 RepID=UPI0032979D8F